MNAPTNSPQSGTVILGKYRLDSVLGQGGMGVVFSAFHLQLEELVAVKVIKPERANARKLADRLVREARAAVKLKNEHVVRILDAGTLENDQPFIVMEHLQGDDLSKVLAERRQLPIPVVVDYLLQTCQAVAEAHSLGIVHRDLKPANLFLQRTSGGERIKVLDFGISRVLETALGEPGFATSTQSLVGSPAYASPEQLASPELVDERTDIWALGVLAYELLTGKAPFAAPNLALVCTRVLHEQPQALRSLRQDVPPALERAVMQALEKRAGRRQQTVLELARSLANFETPSARASIQWIESLDQEHSALRTDGRAVACAGSTTSTAASALLPRPARPRRAAALGATAAIVSAVLGYTMLRLAEPAMGDGSANGVASQLEHERRASPSNPVPSPAVALATAARASVAASASTSASIGGSKPPAAKELERRVPRTTATPPASSASAGGNDMYLGDEMYLHRK